MTGFLPALPHGSLTEVFPNVFLVRGTFKMGPGVSVSRNMTVVRQGGELTILNSVRLDLAGEAALEKLGQVKHVLRIGAGHGADDPYYVDRFRPTLWAPPRMKYKSGLKIDRELAPGQSPLEGATVFNFTHGLGVESALILPLDGGILVSCDSYQHWTSFEGCSALGGFIARMMGFGPTVIGGPWLNRMGPEVAKDFTLLAELPFKHLIPGHGAVLRDDAAAGLKTAMQRRFGG